MKKLNFIILTCYGLSPAAISAHGGGVDRNGCHNERSTGTRHCHGTTNSDSPHVRRSTTRPPVKPESLFSARQTVADEQLRIVQKMLIQLGFSVGEPDGLLDEKTVEAIKTVEEQNGIPITGAVTPELVDILIATLKGGALK